MLPYDFQALTPIMGSDTLFFHHDKHYVGYVEKANELIPQKWHNKSLEQLISCSRKDGHSLLFNQVAQVWNHEFFFNGLSLRQEDKEISGKLLDLIRTDFQNMENLKAELIQAALTRFGSGWVWLVTEEGHLKVQTTGNAETPCGLKGFTPLWTLDVWEHAYYLDYQNRRAIYASEVVNRAINWRFIGQNLSR